MKIVIDPGHGGSDMGAHSKGLQEKNVVLDIAQKLQKLLSSAGHSIKTTRESDVYVDLYERANIANNFNADIFVSIHCNAGNSEQANGTETLYYPGSEKGRMFAGEVQENLLEKLDRQDRGLKKRGDLVVLNSTEMPAVLVEVAFISHPIERKLLRDEGFRQLAAEAIAEGVEEYES